MQGFGAPDASREAFCFCFGSGSSVKFSGFTGSVSQKAWDFVGEARMTLKNYLLDSYLKKRGSLPSAKEVPNPSI